MEHKRRPIYIYTKNNELAAYYCQQLLNKFHFPLKGSRCKLFTLSEMLLKMQMLFGNVHKGSREKNDKTSGQSSILMVATPSQLRSRISVYLSRLSGPPTSSTTNFLTPNIISYICKKCGFNNMGMRCLSDANFAANKLHLELDDLDWKRWQPSYSTTPDFMLKLMLPQHNSPA